MDIDNTPGSYAIIGLTSFDLLDTVYKEFENGSQDKNMYCLEPDQLTTYNNGNSSNDLPTNCGLGVFNLSTTDGNYQDANNVLADPDSELKLSQFCAACKPGYYP